MRWSFMLDATAKVRELPLTISTCIRLVASVTVNGWMIFKWARMSMSMKSISNSPSHVSLQLKVNDKRSVAVLIVALEWSAKIIHMFYLVQHFNYKLKHNFPPVTAMSSHVNFQRVTIFVTATAHLADMHLAKLTRLLFVLLCSWLRLASRCWRSHIHNRHRLLLF